MAVSAGQERCWWASHEKSAPRATEETEEHERETASTFKRAREVEDVHGKLGGIAAVTKGQRYARQPLRGISGQ